MTLHAIRGTPPTTGYSSFRVVGLLESGEEVYLGDTVAEYYRHWGDETYASVFMEWSQP